MPRPSIGRDVHYVAPGSADGRYPPAHRAAKIVEIPIEDIDEWTTAEGNPTLFVMNPTGTHFAANVPYDPEGKRPYSWHWPERVDY